MELIDFGAGLGDFGSELGRGGRGGHAQNGAGKVVFQRRFPFRFEPGKGFLVLAARDGNAEKTGVAFVQIERLNAVGAGGGGIGFGGCVNADQLNLAVGGDLHGVEQLRHAPGKSLKRFVCAARREQRVVADGHRHLQLPEQIFGRFGKPVVFGAGIMAVKPKASQRNAQREGDTRQQERMTARGLRLVGV